MIDYEKLQQAYENDGFYSLQLEIGDRCYQDCIYCYMNAVEKEKNTLLDEQVKLVLRDAKRLGISVIEWLGGEPLLRESIFEHMAMAQELGFQNNVWTGGLPLADETIAKKTIQYAQSGLISVHVSSVDPDTYGKLHPRRSEKDMQDILAATQQILKLGYPASQMLNSVTFTGLQTAEDMIETIDYFETQFGIVTSLNVYHTYLRPETSMDELKKFIPSRKEVAKVYQRYTKQSKIKQTPMNCVNKQYCSTTVALLCDGSVTPCATIREEDAPNIHASCSFYDIALRHRDHLVFKAMKDTKNLPPSCASCKLSSLCWGCRSRAFAAGNGLHGKDPRCFRMKEET